MAANDASSNATGIDGLARKIAGKGREQLPHSVVANLNFRTDVWKANLNQGMNVAEDAVTCEPFSATKQGRFQAPVSWYQER